MSEENPIIGHFVHAPGCDGSLTDFIRRQASDLKYSSAPIDFTPLYKNITTLAVNNVDPALAAVLKELNGQITTLEGTTKQRGERVSEAEKAFITVNNALAKIIPAVDEKLGIKREKK